MYRISNYEKEEYPKSQIKIHHILNYVAKIGLIFVISKLEKYFDLQYFMIIFCFCRRFVDTFIIIYNEEKITFAARKLKLILMKDFVDALKNYANFKGRTSRKSFWIFILINVGISILLGMIGQAVDFVLLSSIYQLAVLVPSLAIGARRMHDVGKSGWFYLIPLYNLYLAIQQGEPNENTWGSPINE